MEREGRKGCPAIFILVNIDYRLTSYYFIFYH